MENYLVKIYKKEYYSLWNNFVATAKNATFLFHRDFMEYHQDRFIDYSLLIFDSKEKLVAILPANIVENEVFSHQGLTYGGLVLKEDIKLGQVINIFKEVLIFLGKNNFYNLFLKEIPSFYNTFFSDEIKYILFLLNSELYRRDCLSVLDLDKKYNFLKSRKKCVRRGIQNSLIIKEEQEIALFWDNLLIPNLSLKHNSKPVHSLEEIIYLQNKFPQNIRHFNVYFENKIVAGSTVFVTDHVAHPQYISGNIQKNELGSIDFLYNHLITNVFSTKKYFDFGPSHEGNSRKINEGILFWKESFGAKSVIQNFYSIETKNHILLDNILI